MVFPKTRFRRALTNWYRRHGRNLPWRQTRDPYAILVSEFMLQQTQAATVIPYYDEWLRRFPDFASLALASENDVLNAWQGLGYYARARNLHATAKSVVSQYGGRCPRSIGQMHQLPGIGKYTSHAIASFGFNQSVPIIEANTARVLARLFDFRRSIESPAGRTMLWEYAANLVPESNARTYNSALVDLGAVVCLSRKPKCSICPVKKFCSAEDPAALPIKKPRPRIKRITEEHAFVLRRRQILLEQSRCRWRGMWILPRLQTDPVNRQPIYRSIFPFTNHRVELNVYAQRSQKIDDHSQRWNRIDCLDSIPIPSPHRRALRYLLSGAAAARARRQQSSGS